MGVYKGAFNMSQEYYSVEKESNLGALNIGLSVFQAIVVKAVESVDGVHFITSCRVHKLIISSLYRVVNSFVCFINKINVLIYSHSYAIIWSRR